MGRFHPYWARREGRRWPARLRIHIAQREDVAMKHSDFTPFLPPQDSFVLSGFRVGGSAMKPKGVVDLFIEPGTGRNRLALLRRYKDPFTVTS